MSLGEQTVCVQLHLAPLQLIPNTLNADLLHKISAIHFKDHFEVYTQVP